MKSDCVVVDFIRTPLCSEKGPLKKYKVEELAQRSMEALIERNTLDPGAVEQVIFGHAHMDTFPYNVARYAWLLAKFPDRVPCYTVNMCGASGLQALQKGFNLAATGNDLTSIVGGCESYSNAPYVLRDARYQMNLDKNPLTDSIREGEFFSQPEPLDPRILAARLAEKKGYTRDEMDKYVSQDVSKASNALWGPHIFPIVWTDRKKGEIRIDSDMIAEPAKGVSFEPGSPVTDQNFGRYADGAVAMLIATEERAAELGKTPLARICAVASAAAEPQNRWEPAVSAVKKLLEKSALPAEEVSVVELIADSAASMMCMSDAVVQLGVKADDINRNGSCLARGVNEGGDGIIAVGSSILALRQNQGRYGVIAAAAAGGQGMAVLIERV